MYVELGRGRIDVVKSSWRTTRASAARPCTMHTSRRAWSRVGWCGHASRM